MPGSRAALAMLFGFDSVSFCFTSLERPTTFSKFKLSGMGVSSFFFLFSYFFFLSCYIPKVFHPCLYFIYGVFREGPGSGKV